MVRKRVTQSGGGFSAGPDGTQGKRRVGMNEADIGRCEGIDVYSKESGNGFDRV